MNVNGIQNTQMKTQLKNALNKINGIRSVDVNMEESTIDVEYSNKTDAKVIQDCIENVGCKIE